MRQVLPTFSLGILLLTIGCRHKDARPPFQASVNFSRYFNEMVLPFWKAAAEKRAKELDTEVNSNSPVAVSVINARVLKSDDSTAHVVGAAVIEEQYHGSVSPDVHDYLVTFVPSGNGWRPASIAKLDGGKTIPRSLDDFQKELGLGTAD